MMFGPWGNADKTDSIRIIHRALDAGINFVDTADVYSAGESERHRRRSPDAGAATTSCWPPSSSCRWTTNPNHRGGSRRWIMTDGRGLAAPPGHRLHRSLPGAPAQPATPMSRKRSAPSPISSARARSATSVPRPTPASQIVEAQWAVPGPTTGTFRHRAAALLDHGARHRGRRAAHGPTTRHGHPDLQPARRRLAVRPLAQGQSPRTPDLVGPAQGPLRHEHARRTSASSRSSKSLAQLAEQTGHDPDRAGHRVRRSTTRPSPPRSSAPAPWSSSSRSCPAPTSRCSNEILDRIDELVAPDVTVNPDDNSYGDHELKPSARRR